MLLEEEYIPIKGFEGLYSISNLGNVKSLKRFCKTATGFRQENEKILRPHKRNNKNYKYLSVSLCKNNKKTTKAIHKLVAENFLNKTIKKGECVHHKDKNIMNNTISNLEIITHKENIRHSSRLSVKDILKIRKSCLSQIDLAQKYDVCQSHISRIQNNKLWRI